MAIHRKKFFQKVVASGNCSPYRGKVVGPTRESVVWICETLRSSVWYIFLEHQHWGDYRFTSERMSCEGDIRRNNSWFFPYSRKRHSMCDGNVRRRMWSMNTVSWEDTICTMGSSEHICCALEFVYTDDLRIEYASCRESHDWWRVHENCTDTWKRVHARAIFKVDRFFDIVSSSSYMMHIWVMIINDFWWRFARLMPLRHC